MKQFVQAALLFVCVGVTATGLYFNPTWRSITRGGSRAWVRHGWIH